MEIMKIKSLFFGALLCASFSACSDDVIDNGQSQKGELENIPAYITVSLTPGSSSSRAEVNGDGHGDAEDSGHHNAGTVAENTVTDLAIIIKSVNEDGTDASNSGVAEIITNNVNDVETIQGNVPILTIKKKFKVLAGEHKVLVIVNPTEAIETAVTSAKDDYTKIAKLYNGLIDGKLSNEYGTEEAIQTENQFMMTNNAEATVRATEANSETSPAVASIEVERVTSKITFRETLIAGEDDANVYPINFNLTHYGYRIYKDNVDNTYALAKDATGITDVLVKGTLADGASAVDDAGNIYAEFTETKDSNGNPKVYAYDSENKTVGEQLDPYELETETSIPDNVYYYPNGETATWIPEYVMQPYYVAQTNWKVKLTEYALVNLNKNVYIVRHTADALGENIKPFGFLTGQNYIADANFAEKNNIAAELDNKTWLDENWYNQDDAKNKYTGWFKNPLADVAAETEGTWSGDASFFKTLPNNTDGEGMNDDYEDNLHADDDAETKDNPGYKLAYCLETTTKAENQKHGLTTGIVFKAKIIAPENADEGLTLYQYDKKVFKNIDEIIKGYGPGNDDIAKLATLTETTNQEEKDAAIQAAGIKIYRNDYCYYYSSQIKHFDNGDNNVAGNMEFAIVRNNIYSLAVSDIKNIGDASIDPNPDTDDESAVGYIEVEAKILPWIVRYQNIEF